MKVNNLMTISNKMKNFLKQGSWIRRMFEDGIELKKKNNFVEAVGIEPTSEYTVQIVSTCLGHY